MKRRDIIKGLSILPLAGGIGNMESAFADSNITSALQPKTGKSTYEPLGVRRLINGGGTVTVVGAVRLLPEVQKAMGDATKEYVHLDELMEGVGRRLAELTGAESGCITPGASAAVTAGTAACVTGGDPDKLWMIPDTRGMKDEVIIPAYSRSAYDAGARAVGVRMVQVSDIAELKSAIGPRTAMILVLGGAQSRNGPLSLKEISDIAKPMGVPILVDAAAEGLEVPNPHIAQGADLVAYSGGKKLRGPQCSGMLIGRKGLITAARINTGPHHGFGRGYKVGREEIMGLMAAVEMWFKRDMAAEAKVAALLAETIANRLRPIPGLTVNGGAGAVAAVAATAATAAPAGGGQGGGGSVRLTWDMTKIPLTGSDVEQLLYDGNPRIVVSLSGSYLPFPPNMQPNVSINTTQLEPGEEKIIAERVFALLSNPPKLTKPSAAPATDLSGQWDLELRFGASTVNHSIVLEQKTNNLLGTHYGTIGSRGMQGTIHGNDILMRSSYSLGGARINYTFTGTVNGNIMEGKVSLSEYGKAEWTAKRHVYAPILVR